MRRLAACLAMVVLLAQGMTGGPVRTAAAAPTEKSCPAMGNKIPVILVHGWNSGKTVWQTGGFSPKLSGLSGVFVDDQFDYSSDSSQWVTKDSIGPALARRVMHLATCSTGQGGKGKVVLVGHSMGGLAIRCAASQECSKVPGVADKIALVVTMGTPNLGAWIRGNKFASFAEQILLEELKAGCQGRNLDGPGLLLGATSSMLPICPLVGEAAGPAGVAFTEGSQELNDLPWFPEKEKAFPVLALAAHKRLTVTLFTKTHTFNDNVGDMVVNQKSAEQDVRVKNSLGGKAVIDCGTYDFTIQGMFSTCWHGSEVSNSEFQQHVYDEIEKLTRSLGLADVTAADLRSAPVPPLCGHPSGRLERGSLPGLNTKAGGPGQGYESINAQGVKDSFANKRPVLADLTGDGVGDAAAVLSCSAGGVSWPETVLVYGPGPRLLGQVDLSKFQQAEHADVSSLKLEQGGVRILFKTYDGCCFDMASWSVHFRVHEDRLVVGLLVSESACPQAPTLHAAWDRRYPNSTAQEVTHITCSGDWAVAAVGPGLNDYTEAGPGVNDYIVTGTFQRSGGEWTAVDPAGPCTRNKIPAVLYTYVCTSGE